MKLTILKHWLNEAMQHVSKAINGKNSLPILSGIKMDVTAQGVTLTASDIDTTIQATIPAATEDGAQIVTVDEPGSVVLPAKLLVEMIKKLPKEEVHIETEVGFAALLKSGKTKINMVGMDPEEFPAVPALTEERSFTIAGSDIRDMIRETVFAVSTQETSPILTGVLWQLEPSKLTLLATDRHRLAQTAAEVGDGDNALIKFVVSGKMLTELNKVIADDSGDVEITATQSQVLFKVGRTRLYCRILDGTYPDTSKIIPTAFKSELVVSTKAINAAIDRAFLLAREEKTNIVRLETGEDNAVTVSSNSSGLGSVSEQLEAESITGEPVRISFNSKYMLDVLKVIDSEQLRIGFTGPMSPIIIKPVDGKDSLYLILPYRTTN
ncbi:DNA polymerase III subunit beta [Paenibacillus antibioticophila]|uniref:Beta sliding clamp n=1 Tax=Paenibacillus antibioticophila TaxID=1274374 RepID=A0A920CH89_9BACL|nr:DNA polymerase III subunit beta [Paenibacillus antibioticophila]GIO40166.1 DNA polymerase III subunit beta [Paenibacillus antibioticophila]